MWTQKAKGDGKDRTGVGKSGGTISGGGGVARKCGGWQKLPGGVELDGKFLLVKDECWNCGEVGHKGIVCRIEDRETWDCSFIAVFSAHGVTIPSNLKL